MPAEMPAARPTDSTSHLGVPAAPGVGAASVLIGGLPAWRTLVDTHACGAPTPAPHGPEKCYMGSTTVLINNQMACRLGDILQGLGPPNVFIRGCPTVIIGDNGFGMARANAKERFAASMKKLLQDWDQLTPADRLDTVKIALNRVSPQSMPKVEVFENASLLPGTLGQFDFSSWSIQINPDFLSGAMDESVMGRLTNTAYHEGRHAEQWWNAAQYRAAGGTSSGDITNETGMPQPVADAAVASPAPGGTSENAMGESVHESVYGGGRDHRNAVLTSIDKGAYNQYRALPEEEDAWREGDDVEQVFRNAP
jgi:uncharacterized Zn-binding protein involved in type VI secretion